MPVGFIWDKWHMLGSVLFILIWSHSVSMHTFRALLYSDSDWWLKFSLQNIQFPDFMALSCKVFVDSLREATLILWIRVTTLAHPQIRLKWTIWCSNSITESQNNLQVIVNSVGHAARSTSCCINVIFWMNKAHSGMEQKQKQESSPCLWAVLSGHSQDSQPDVPVKPPQADPEYCCSGPQAPIQAEVWVAGTQRNLCSQTSLNFPVHESVSSLGYPQLTLPLPGKQFRSEISGHLRCENSLKSVMERL